MGEIDDVFTNERDIIHLTKEIKCKDCRYIHFNTFNYVIYNNGGPYYLRRDCTIIEIEPIPIDIDEAFKHTKYQFIKVPKIGNALLVKSSNYSLVNGFNPSLSYLIYFDLYCEQLYTPAESRLSDGNIIKLVTLSRTKEIVAINQQGKRVPSHTLQSMDLTFKLPGLKISIIDDVATVECLSGQHTKPAARIAELD